MSIVSEPDGPEIKAAESVNLTCQATGGTGMYSYLWSSTCTRNCFLNTNSQMSRMITRDALQSVDTGVYTCSVTDNAGNSGSNSTEVEVIGKICLTSLIQSQYYWNLEGTIRNNIIILINKLIYYRKLQSLYCQIVLEQLAYSL